MGTISAPRTSLAEFANFNSCLRRFVTEPERDHAQVYTMLQQAHRRRVAEACGVLRIFP